MFLLLKLLYIYTIDTYLFILLCHFISFLLLLDESNGYRNYESYIIVSE